MLTEKFKWIYSWVNELGPNTKSVIIIFLLAIIIQGNFKREASNLINTYVNQVQQEKIDAEEYTKTITPDVNNRLEQILLSDSSITNVILLNYHNTITSIHGLSYLYLTALTEKKKGVSSNSCFNVWKELSYLYYGEEFEKVHDSNCLIIDSVSHCNSDFPKINRLLEISDAKSAALYPIEGVDRPVGMIVIMSNKPREYTADFFQRNVAQQAQKLSALLDYNSIKKKVENEN